MVQTYSERATSPKKQKKGEKKEKRKEKTLVAVGAHAIIQNIEERRTIERKVAASVKAKDENERFDLQPLILPKRLTFPPPLLGDAQKV